MATGNGAYILHKNIEQKIKGYSVLPFNPYRTLFPPLLLPLGRFKQVEIIHTTPDYGIFHWRNKIPLILTFHGFVLDEFIQRYSSLLQAIHYKTDLRWFTHLAISRAFQLTAVSQFTADLAKKELSFDGKIKVIYNGIDQHVFYPKKTKNNRKIQILFAGNLTQKKGVHWLLPIINRLNSNIEILYTNSSKKLNYLNHPRIRPLGRIAYQKMVDVYQQVDILLFPTVREGFGLVVAEAMACSLPVVASDCSSLPELIDHGKGGFLCPVGDVAAFAEKINLLADNAFLRNEMGEYNRVKVESKFTLDRMICEYKVLFEKTLDER